MINVNDENIAYLNEYPNKDLIVVDFWADWCGPCKVFSKTFEEAANLPEFSHILFAKANAEECADATSNLKIRSLPTVVIFDMDGKEKARFTGLKTMIDFIDFIHKNS